MCLCGAGQIVETITTHEYMYPGPAQLSVEITCPACAAEWTASHAHRGGLDLTRRSQAQARRQADELARNTWHRIHGEICQPLSNRLYAHLKAHGRTKDAWASEVNRLLATTGTAFGRETLQDWCWNYVRPGNAGAILAALGMDTSMWAQLYAEYQAQDAHAKSIQVETRYLDTAIRLPPRG